MSKTLVAGGSVGKRMGGNNRSRSRQPLLYQRMNSRSVPLPDRPPAQAQARKNVRHCSSSSLNVCIDCIYRLYNIFDYAC